jgi:hypothetical protein
VRKNHWLPAVEPATNRLTAVRAEYNLASRDLDRTGCPRHQGGLFRCSRRGRAHAGEAMSGGVLKAPNAVEWTPPLYRSPVQACDSQRA